MPTRYLLRDVRPDGTIIRTWTTSAAHELNTLPQSLGFEVEGPWERQAVVLEDGKPEQWRMIFRVGDWP